MSLRNAPWSWYRRQWEAGAGPKEPPPLTVDWAGPSMTMDAGTWTTEIASPSILAARGYPAAALAQSSTYAATNGVVLPSGTVIADAWEAAWVSPNEWALPEDVGGRVLFLGYDGEPFSPRITVNGYARAVADGQGGVYLFGSFTKVNDTPRMRLAHITSTGELSDWDPGSTATPFWLTYDDSHVYITISSTSSSPTSSLIGGVTAAFHKVDRVTGLSEGISMGMTRGPTVTVAGDYIYWVCGKAHSAYSFSVAGRSNAYAGRLNKHTKLHDSTWQLTTIGGVSTAGMMREVGGYVYYCGSATVFGAVGLRRIDVTSPLLDETWGGDIGYDRDKTRILDFDDGTHVYLNLPHTVRYPPTVGGAPLIVVGRIPHSAYLLDTAWGFTTHGNNSLVGNVYTTITEDKVWFCQTGSQPLVFDGQSYSEQVWSMDRDTLSVKQDALTCAPAFSWQGNYGVHLASDGEPAAFAFVRTNVQGVGAYAQLDKRFMVYDRTGTVLKLCDFTGASGFSGFRDGMVPFIAWSAPSATALDGTPVPVPITRLDPVTFEPDLSWSLSAAPVSSYKVLATGLGDGYAYVRSGSPVGGMSSTALWRFSTASGAVDNGWSVESDKLIADMVADDDWIYLSMGQVPAVVQGVTVDRLCRVSRATLEVDEEWSPPVITGPSYPDIRLSLAGGWLYCATYSTRVTIGSESRRLFRLDAATGALDTGWSPDIGIPNFTTSEGTSFAIDTTGTQTRGFMGHKSVIPAYLVDLVTGAREDMGTAWLYDPRFGCYISPLGEMIALGTSLSKGSESLPAALGIMAFDFTEV